MTNRGLPVKNTIARWRLVWWASAVLGWIALAACTPPVDDDLGREPTAPAPPTTTPAPPLELLTGDDRSPALRRLTADWATNWALRIIDSSELLSGGPPRDGIPSIDRPTFIGQAEAAAWLAGREPVIAVEIDGDARAYPLQILTWHEIVNDTVGGTPVAVTFCPLCNSAVVFERARQGEAFELGVSGLLRNSDLVMYDRTTETLWQQLDGRAIIGDLAGAQLAVLPSSLVSFAAFREAHPSGLVLSRETGFVRRYGVNPYEGYDQSSADPFLFRGEIDRRLPATERVVAVTIGEVDVAYPFPLLAAAGVVHDTVGDRELVIFHLPGMAGALGAAVIADAADVGSATVFDRLLDGQRLTFTRRDNRFVDQETGSTWNVMGQALEGPLAGRRLNPILYANHFWFAWAAFKPETLLYTEP